MSEDRSVEERVSDLEAAVAELREAGDGRQHRSGVDRFLEAAVPMGLAAVEAQLRTMEAVLEAVDDGAASDGVGDRSEASFQRLDAVLDRLERELDAATESGGRDVGAVIDEIRGVQAEIEDRVQGRASTRSEAGDDRGVRIDVESELETIREEVDAEDDDAG